MNLQQRFSDVRCLVVVVSTPLQYFNALELAEQLNPQLRCLVISYPAGTHEKFLGLPAIDRWQHVEMVQTELGKGEPPLKMRWIGPLWRFYKELRNDLRALRKLRGLVGEFANPEARFHGDELAWRKHYSSRRWRDVCGQSRRADCCCSRQEESDSSQALPTSREASCY